MDTKKLRQKILDLAIHGKLVPQDPNDEPASVLLERIRAEKETLIKEGKIKKSKKSTSSDMPHYENVPFDIPEGWQWTTIGEVSSSILYGVSESAKEVGAYKLLRITDIQDNKVNWESVPSTDFDQDKALNYLLQDGDILFARTGATVGKSYLVSGLNEKSIYASYLIRVQTSHSILPEYIKRFFESGYYWEQISLSSVGIGQPNVNGTTLANLNIPIPPYKEQLRIVEETNRWLSLADLIDDNAEHIGKVIESAKSRILDLAIHGKLVPQDPNDEPASELLKRINPKAVASCDNPHYGLIPNSWSWTNLGLLFDIVSAKRVTKDQWKTSGVPFFRTREIVQLSLNGYVDNDLFIDEEHYLSLKSKYGIPMPNDIMLTAVGTIGKTYVVSEDDRFYYKDASVLCLKNSHNINPQYITLAFSSPLVQTQLFEKSKGTTVDTITIEKANNYMVPIPPVEEQRRIVSKVKELFSQLDMIEESLQA